MLPRQDFVENINEAYFTTRKVTTEAYKIEPELFYIDFMKGKGLG